MVKHRDEYHPPRAYPTAGLQFFLSLAGIAALVGILFYVAANVLTR